MDRRSRSPQKKETKRRPISITRRRKQSVDEGRQVTHAFKEFAAHNANVNCLALGHKSGRVLVTGGDDKKVNLWAVGKPNCVLSLSGHSTAVECVRFGSTEGLVCAGSQSGALKIWDLEATKIVRTLTGHKANIRSIDFHPYGDFICTGSLDTNIKLWDIRRKGCIFTYKGHNQTVNSLKFSPDGQWIASAGEDHAVKLWDLRAGKMLTEFSSHTGPVSDVEFHPHEFLLASASHDRTVNFWDLEKFQLVSTTDADTGPIRTIAFHPTGECIYAGATDVLKVYGWEPSRTFDTVAMGWGKIQDVAISENQLIGAAFHGVYVSLYVIDLKRVQPFGGPEYDGVSFRHGAAIRKSFIKDKTSGKASCDSIKTEEASDTGGEEPQEEDPPPIISNVNDYRSIFTTQRELQRTPPPPSGNENEHVPHLARLDTLHSDSPQRNPPISLPRSPDFSRKYNSTGLPRPVPRYDSNSNTSLNTNNSTPTLPNLPSERRGSTNDIPSQFASSQRESNQSPNNGLSRLRASSENRRDTRENLYGSHPGLDQDSRFNIRHSPSEPYISQSPTGPPMSSSPPVQQSALPNLRSEYRKDPKAINRPVSRPPFSRDASNSTSGSDLPYSKLASSEPEISYRALKDQDMNFRPATDPEVYRPQKDPDISYMGTPKEPEISYMGTPKEPKYNIYAPDITPSRDLFSTYSVSSHKENFDDFLPKQFSGMSMGGMSEPNAMTGFVGTELSEQEVINGVMRGHTSMLQVMTNRTRALQIARRLWQSQDVKSAVEHALNSSDQAVLVDFLSILNLRPSIWNLDIVSLLLPPVSHLLQSKHETSINCGCDTLKLMVRNFAPMIKSNMAGPIHSVGVDISREERYNKCIECYNHMMSIRASLLKRQTVPGKMGHTYRELVILMQAFE